jgi:hypothetical protein
MLRFLRNDKQDGISCFCNISIGAGFSPLSKLTIPQALAKTYFFREKILEKILRKGILCFYQK